MLRNATFVASESISADFSDQPRVGLFWSFPTRNLFSLSHHLRFLSVYSCKTVLHHFFISDFLWLNSKLAVLLIVCHPYRGLAVLRQASVSTAHQQLTLAQRYHHPPSHHKDFDQKPGNVRTMKWQVLALQRLHSTFLTLKSSVLKAQSMCILGIFP